MTSVIQGSEVIDGMTYWKVYESYKEDLSDLKQSNYYLRQDGDKIYWRYSNESEDRFYMDFGLKKGDTLLQIVVDLEVVEVEVTDTILPNGDGISRKCLKIGMHGSNDLVWDTWVEGIGSLTFGIDRLCIGCVGGESSLFCCHDSEKSFYMNEYYHTCFREMLPMEKLVEQNKRWAVEITSCNMSNTRTDTYILKGDTLINNRFIRKYGAHQKKI